MSTRPLVGLTTYREDARWGVWTQRADVLQVEYADAVVRAGGVPVLLPPVDPTLAHDAVSRIDALVVVGGADVEPARYGEEASPQTVVTRPDRDAWEIALLAAADAVDLPVLGVCRGMQVMAVAAGGRLEQHTPDRVGDTRHSPGGDVFGDVVVRAEAGSRVAVVAGSEFEVRCHHHQAVASHPGFRAVAWAQDETVEAMEAESASADGSRRFCVGVQWHPEMDRDQGLFSALVAAAVGGRSPQ